MIWKLIAVVFLRTASDLSFKGAVHGIHIPRNRALGRTILQILLKPLLWVGFLLGVANVFVWTSALESFDLSYAYPFLSFSFVTIILGGRIFFNETLDRYKLLGVISITIGSLLLFIS